MKKLTALMLVFILILSACALAEPTGIYNYSVMVSAFDLRIMVDSSWEELALTGNLRFYVDNRDTDHGSVLIEYMSTDGSIPLVRVDARTEGVLPGEGQPEWTAQYGDWTYDVYLLERPSGAVYDTLLLAFAEESDALQYIDSSAKWQFDCIDLDGNTVSGTSLYGSTLTMVNMWATYCSPCIHEMPFLGELSQEYADKGFKIVGIITDVNELADAEYAKKLVKEAGAEYQHVLANDDMYLLLSEVEYVPTTIFIDENGTELGRYVGSMEKSEWEAIILGYLANE